MEQMLAARQRGLRRGSEQQSTALSRQMFSVPELTQGELVALAGYSLKESLCLAEGAGDEDPRSHDHWYRRDAWPSSDGRYWEYRGHSVGGGYCRGRPTYPPGPGYLPAGAGLPARRGWATCLPGPGYLRLVGSN